MNIKDKGQKVNYTWTGNSTKEIYFDIKENYRESQFIHTEIR